MRGRRSTPSVSDAFEDLRADYNAAKSSRFRRTRTGIASLGSTADYHYRNESDFLRIMELARDMDRNDVIVGQTIDRATLNTVQDGFTLSMQTGDSVIDDEIEARFAEWAEDPDQCDLTGQRTFSGMTYMALRHTHVDGDAVALGTEDGTLQLVEAHRMRTPRNTTKNVVHGVLLNANGKPLEYWLTRKDLGLGANIEKVGDMVVMPARDSEGFKQVFHVFNPKRVTQSRGVSAIAPIVDTLGMFEDIQFAKLLQQQIVSCFAILRNRESGFMGDSSAQYGALTTDTRADGTSRTLEGIGPGMEIQAAPGEKLEGFSPSVPNAEFFQHVRLILQLIGVNLGLPLVLVLLDASETNFSGFRGAVDQARMGFRHNQRFTLVQNLHRPVAIWKIRQWMAEDATLRAASIRDGISIYKHRWNPPTWPYIQPFDDAKADELRASTNQNSLRRIYAERGLDYYEVMPEIVQDRQEMILEAIARAEEINTKYPDAAVNWRDLAGMTDSAPAPAAIDPAAVAREVQRGAANE